MIIGEIMPWLPITEDVLMGSPPRARAATGDTEYGSRKERVQKRMTSGRHSAPQPAPDPPSGKPLADRTAIRVARIGAVSAIVAAAIGAVATLFSNRDPAVTAPAPLASASATVLPSSGTDPSATVQSPATAPSSTETPKAVASQLFLSSQSPSKAATAALSARRSWKIENAPFSHSIGFPGLCSRADVTYNLNGSYTSFNATAGIADGLSPKDTSRSVEFDVFNGKSGVEIYSGTAQYGKSQTIKFLVEEGITSIRLEASVVGGGCLSRQSVVVWGNAWLGRLSSSGGRPVALESWSGAGLLADVPEQSCHGA